jgi:hypothetical protein
MAKEKFEPLQKVGAIIGLAAVMGGAADLVHTTVPLLQREQEQLGQIRAQLREMYPNVEETSRYIGVSVVGRGSAAGISVPDYKVRGEQSVEVAAQIRANYIEDKNRLYGENEIPNNSRRAALDMLVGGIGAVIASIHLGKK